MSQVDPNIGLEQAQETMINLVNTYRDGLMLNYFTFAGSRWDSDPQSVQNVMGTCIIAMLNQNNLPPGFQWRDFDNNMHTATGMFMYGLMVAGATFVTSTYQASWQHKTNILQLQDPISVQEYDYMSTLWPDPNA